MSEISVRAPAASGEFLGHPKGLVVCFFTEMWERFSYYGMRALLIFYLTQHFLFSDEAAAGIYAAYISLVYITPVLGGVVADRYLGAKRAVTLGAILLIAGHTGMALEGSPAVQTMVGDELTVERNSFYLQIFYFSLALIIMGVGFLKANISTLVGSLYQKNDPRRDGAFTLFYMGINTGALLGALICGLLLQYGGFSWGFGAASIGMLAGLIVFIRGKHLLGGDAGEPENPQLLQRKLAPGLNTEWLIYLLAIGGVLVFWQLMQYRELVGGLLAFFLVLMIAVVLGYSFIRCEPPRSQPDARLPVPDELPDRLLGIIRTDGLLAQPDDRPQRGSRDIRLRDTCRGFPVGKCDLHHSACAAVQLRLAISQPQGHGTVDADEVRPVPDSIGYGLPVACLRREPGRRSHPGGPDLADIAVVCCIPWASCASRRWGCP